MVKETEIHIMNRCFKKFINNITLTPNQVEDAQTKYTGVCEKLYSKYYDGSYNENKKFLFGSYKTKTNIRPLSEMQDVDVLFKIPQGTFDRFDNYASNGQSALLQEVRACLQERYTTTDKIKAWGKVVLVQFADNHHNVELLPALELDDGTFKIPNSENGGAWEIFDPRTEIDIFEESNGKTNGLTRELAKMIKAWASKNENMNYKSCEQMGDIILFLSDNYVGDANNVDYARVVFDFFDYKRTRCDDNSLSYITKAYKFAQKALEYYDDGKAMEASEQWRYIFGNEFPLADEVQRNMNASKIINPARPWSH